MRTVPAARFLAIILILASLGMVFLSWVSALGLDYTFKDAVEESIKDGIGSDTESTVVPIIAVALAVTALFGIIFAILGMPGGLAPYFVASLGYLGGAIYLVNMAKQQAYGFSIASMGIGAYALPGLALLAFLVMFVREREY